MITLAQIPKKTGPKKQVLMLYLQGKDLKSEEEGDERGKTEKRCERTHYRNGRGSMTLARRQQASWLAHTLALPHGEFLDMAAPLPGPVCGREEGEIICLAPSRLLFLIGQSLYQGVTFPVLRSCISWPLQWPLGKLDLTP